MSELRTALESALEMRVESVERTPFAYQTSHALDALDVRTADGRELHLLVKDLGALSDEAQRAKPAFVRDPLREIAVYRELLPGLGLGTAECHGAAVDEERGRYWLFLERVDGDVLWQVGELAVWEDVARALARLHAAGRGVAHARLLRYDRALYETWLERALAGPAGPRLRPLAAGYERIVRRLLELPATFVHGEAYPSNVLVDGARVCLVDWEMAAAGPGLLDVAALTAGWGDGERDRILRAYGDALPDAPPWDALADGLACCRLQIALQWLGWAPGWSPPAEHATNWLAEALDAAERLELVG